MSAGLPLLLVIPYRQAHDRACAEETILQKIASVTHIDNIFVDGSIAVVVFGVAGLSRRVPWKNVATYRIFLACTHVDAVACTHPNPLDATVVESGEVLIDEAITVVVRTVAELGISFIYEAVAVVVFSVAGLIKVSWLIKWYADELAADTLVLATLGTHAGKIDLALITVPLRRVLVFVDGSIAVVVHTVADIENPPVASRLLFTCIGRNLDLRWRIAGDDKKPENHERNAHLNSPFLTKVFHADHMDFGNMVYDREQTSSD